MKYEPKVLFTTPARPSDDAPEWVRKSYEEHLENLTLRCADSNKVGQLQVKLEEYIRRIQTSINPSVVCDTIAKIAIVDKILVSNDQSVNYLDAFEYSKEGLRLYGDNLLIDSHEEADGYFVVFDNAYKTIKSYVISGNNNVVGGTQLPEL